MTVPLRLMCVFAHPDDESMGTGGILAKYAAEGVETYLLTATRGQRGWQGAPDEKPDTAALGQLREKELHAAAEVLGLREVLLLDYMDGDLDQAAPDEVIGTIVAYIRRVRPQVVVTFDPFGVYGHPDHIAISQFTSAAVVVAADADYPTEQAAYRVAKLYYTAETQTVYDLFMSGFGDIVMEIDGMKRRAVPWAEWAVSATVNTSAYWQQATAAIAAHSSQLPKSWQTLPDEFHQQLWQRQSFYRVFSLVNGGRAVESDLFAGLR